MLRKLLHLAWPVFVSQVAVMLNGFIDTVMAGRLSALDLAAVGVGAAVHASVFVAMMGLLLALTPTVAHHYGARRPGEIGEDVRQAGWLTLALSLAAFLLLRHPAPLLQFSQLQPEVELKVRAYLGILAWSVPASLAFRVFYGFSAGIGRTRPIMMFSLLGLACKVPLNWLFIHGHGGFPALGAPGCALASALISWLVCLTSWGWCARESAYREYGVFARWTWPDRRRLLTLLRLGLPIGATFLVDVTAFTFMALFIARLGPTASGAHQIAANLAALTYMLPMALGNAAGVLVGQSLGAGDPAAARRVGLMGLALGLGFAVLTAGLLYLGNNALAAIYSRDAAVRDLAAQLIGFVAIYHLADGLQAVVVNLIRGYKKAAVPMVIYAVALWGLGLAGGIVLGLGDLFGPPRGPAGFWTAATGGLFLAGGLVTLYWWRLAAQSVTAPAPRATTP